VVATDDTRIFDHVKNFGGEVLMTDPSHASGTDRCAEAAGQISGYDLVINVQGDEPFIRPQQIDDLIRDFKQHNSKDCPIGTMVKRIASTQDLFNANVVKVVTDRHNRALYFSRQAIPFMRGIEQQDWLSQHDFFKHLGIYIFRTEVLHQITRLPMSALEKVESLEQLRWLENGFSIFTVETKFETFGIDTPEDLLKWKQKQ